MKIIIETIPHNSQAYETCGNWRFLPDSQLRSNDEFGILIEVSELGDWRMEACVAIHEAVEVLMCRERGINQEVVDAFDIQFEKEREQGLHSDDAECGDDAKAPYYKEHQIATGIERILAAQLGVDWNTYADKIVALKQDKKGS